MKKLRAIPYGYVIEKGATIISPEEAKTVQRIFNEYLQGLSLKNIADNLNEAGITYSEASPEWNRSNVKRILDNPKYIGDKEFPVIITHGEFESVKAVKTAKHLKGNRRPLPLEIEVIKHVACCKQCGGQYKRSVDNRHGEKWSCKNGKCRSHKRITDLILQEGINELLNQIIAEPEIIRHDHVAEADISMGMTKKRNELRREIGKTDPDVDRTKALLMEVAAEQYRICRENDPAPTEALKEAFKSAVQHPHFNAELFRKTVKKLLIADDGNVELILINGQKVSK